MRLFEALCQGRTQTLKCHSPPPLRESSIKSKNKTHLGNLSLQMNSQLLTNIKDFVHKMLAIFGVPLSHAERSAQVRGCCFKRSRLGFLVDFLDEARHRSSSFWASRAPARSLA